MIKSQYYLSAYADNLDSVCFESGLTEGEIEDIVGRFPSDHHRWAGKLRGQVWMYEKEGELFKIQLRHHFSKKVLWEYKT